jgi:GTP-binding nuclear protein Ran
MATLAAVFERDALYWLGLSSVPFLCFTAFGPPGFGRASLWFLLVAGRRFCGEPGRSQPFAKNQRQVRTKEAAMAIVPQQAHFEGHFKIVVLGEGGVGKTTFVLRHETGEFRRRYEPTKGCAVVQIPFFTTHGEVIVDIWDTAGQEKLGGLRDGYYINAHAAILMFDVASRDTYKKVAQWHRDIARVAGNIPMVLVGNKVDIKDRKVRTKTVTFHRKKNLSFFEMSAKSNYNIEKPFVSLLRSLFGDKTLQLVEQVPVAPPDPSAELTEEQKRQLQLEFEAAQQLALPPEEDDDL